MSGKSFVIVLFIVAASISGVAIARTPLTLDKTPNENRKMKLDSVRAAISTEKIAKELLVEAKKTNELLEQLIQATK